MEIVAHIPVEYFTIMIYILCNIRNSFDVPLKYSLIAITRNVLLREAPTQTPFAEKLHFNTFYY